MNYKYFSIIIFAGISAFLLLSPIIVNAVECTSVPAGGSYVVTSSCSFNTPTMTGDDIGGVDNGGITINNGANLLVTSNQKIIWGPGQSIVINGSITIDNGGSLTQTNIWMYDNDTDGYPASLTTQVFAQDSTPGAGYRRRNVLTSYTSADVDDGNVSVWQNLNCYTDGDGDGYALGGTASTESGADCPSGMSLTSSGTDCLDSDADIYQNIANLADDTDKDRWYTGSLATRCVGAKSSYWYKNAAGIDQWISTGDKLGTSDCDTGDITKWSNRWTTPSSCITTSACVGNHAGYVDNKPTYTLFITSQVYGGDLGGVSGADSKCNSLASSAGLSGTYTAWVSATSSTEPRDRGLNACAGADASSMAWHLVDGSLVFNNYNALRTGTAPAVAINKTELGGGYPAGGTNNQTFTNTRWQGSINTCGAEGCGDYSCSAYTSSSGALYSRPGKTNDTAPCGTPSNNSICWTQDYRGRCDNQRSLFCFQSSN